MGGGEDETGLGVLVLQVVEGRCFLAIQAAGGGLLLGAAGVEGGQSRFRLGVAHGLSELGG